MGASIPTSGKAVAAFLAGLLSLACGVLTFLSGSDLFLLGIVVFLVLALILGIWSWSEINRASGHLRGKGFAGCGMGIPVGGFALGFLLLPAT